MAAIETEEVDGVLLVSFNDAKILEDQRIQQIGQELLEQSTRAVNNRMLLDFRNVTFMSSAMIGKLVLLNKKCKTDGVTLKLCCITPNIAEVFKIMSLNKVFDIYKDQEKAIKSFDKKGWFG